MKQTIVVLMLLILVSCGNSGITTESITGEWQLTEYSEGDENPFRKNLGPFEITDCDKLSVWHFTNSDLDPLNDGTEVKLLKVVADRNCKFYDFECKWTLKGKKLFLSTSNLGGIGGRSYAGQFEIEEFDGNTMTIGISDAHLSFKKIK